MVKPQHSHRPPLRSVLEAYVNVTAGDRIIGVIRAGIVTVTLPTAEVRKGRVYTRDNPVSWVDFHASQT